MPGVCSIDLYIYHFVNNFIVLINMDCGVVALKFLLIYLNLTYIGFNIVFSTYILYLLVFEQFLIYILN